MRSKLSPVASMSTFFMCTLPFYSGMKPYFGLQGNDREVETEDR